MNNYLEKINFHHRNVRRCLPENSLVYTENGLVRIQNIKVGDKVLTFSGYYPVINIFKQGKQKILKIITENGEFECTSNHSIAVLTNNKKYKWKLASQLNYGNKLILSNISLPGEQTKLPETKDETLTIPELTTDIAWFLGLFHGKGNIYIGNSKTSYISLIRKKYGSEFIFYKARIILEKFSKDLIFHTEEENKLFIFYCFSDNIVKYFRTNIKKLTSEFLIQDYIMKSTYNIKIAYIAGIIDSNSFIQDKKLIITSIFKNFIKDIHNLLISCGIKNNFRSKLNKYDYSISISISTIPEFVNKYYIQNINPTNKNSSFLTSKVISIEEEENNCDTYDIEIKDVHEFYCDGYLTYNSVENQ